MAKTTPPKSPSAKAADPLASLEQDHRTVEQHFARLEAAKSADERQRAFLEIKAALSLHATLEEHILYPAVRTCPDPHAQAEVTDAFDEHEDVKGALAEIAMTSPEAPMFLAKCLGLKALVAHHVEEEEDSLFPRARKLLGPSRLQALGQRLADVRAEHARAAPPPPQDRPAKPRKR